MATRTGTKLILPILVLLIAGFAYSYLTNSKPERQKPVLAEKVWQIEVLEVRLESLSPSVTLYGRVESPEQLQAAAPGGGIVEKVFVRDGVRVQQGQALITMDRRDFEAAVLRAEADMRDLNNQISELKVRHDSNLSALSTERELLALSQAEVERLVTLQAQNLSADTAINSARSEQGLRKLSVTSRALEVDSYPAKLKILEARLDRAKAELDQASLAMSRSAIHAPFDAVISKVEVAAGDRVSLGQLLVTLFPIDSLEIRAHLPVNHIRSVQQATLGDAPLYATVPNRPYLGRFPTLRLAGEAEATGIDLYLGIDTAVGQVRPGDLLRLQLELPPQQDVIALPYQAIYGNSRVYKVVDERLQALDVTTVGQARNADDQVKVLIRSDRIEDGDLVAVTHLPNAVTGLKVKISGQ